MKPLNTNIREKILQIYPIVIILICCYIFTKLDATRVYMGYQNLLFELLILFIIICFYMVYLYNRPQINPYIFSIYLACISFWITNASTYSILTKEKLIFQIGNYLLHLIPFLLGCFLNKHYKIWGIIWIGVFSVYGLIQYYVFKFRGIIATFHDMPNIKSAKEISVHYNFNMDVYIIFNLILLIFTILVLIFGNITEHTIKHIIISESICVCICIMSICYVNFLYHHETILVGSTSISYSIPYEGNLINVYYDTVYNRIIKPKTYDTDTINKQINTFVEEPYESKEPVTIIAILNESWADLSLITDIETNQDYLYHWRNFNGAYKGYVTVSPYGSYTANSEFEFLTGDSMYYLPQNVGVFTNYLKHNINSNVSYLSDLGFETVAYSHCQSTMWNRDIAYEYLGFNQKIFLSDNVEVYNIAYIKDIELYDGLNDIVDNQDKDKSYFYFITTSQNHKPFYMGDTDNKITISDEKYSNDTDLYGYLNKIQQTDEAFYELTQHYKDKDEKVIIVMFGDHYPHMDTTYKQLFDNTDYSEEEQNIILHQTPFIVWSNQDLGEYSNQFNNNISLNYLMNDVFDIADIPLSSQQQQIEQYRQNIPIITSFGYKDINDVWTFDKTIQNDIINNYQQFQYYELFDNHTD